MGLILITFGRFYNHFHMFSFFLLCSYAGHAAVSIKISRFEAGVKDLQFKATLRVVLKPLLKHPPFLGGIQLYFLTQPVSVEQHGFSLFYGHIHTYLIANLPIDEPLLGFYFRI